MVEHVDDGGALRVGNVIKDLINLARVLYTIWDLDGVGAVQRVKVKRREAFYGEELFPDVEVWTDVICGKEGSPSGKTLLKPELVPPGKGDQVAKPLMGNLEHMAVKLMQGGIGVHLMGDQNGDILP